MVERLERRSKAPEEKILPDGLVHGPDSRRHAVSDDVRVEKEGTKEEVLSSDFEKQTHYYSRVTMGYEASISMCIKQ